MKKKKSTFGNFLTKLTAGAAIGVATYMIFKTERNHIQNQKVSKNKAKKEQLFI